jgi:hypothetical protein
MSKYHWLSERLARAQRIAKELELMFIWTQAPSATDDQLKECAAEFGRLNMPFSPSYRDFLEIANGATLEWNSFDETGELGNVITIFSTDQICEAARGIYLGNRPPETDPIWMPQDFWEPALPFADLQASNYLAFDPDIMTDGEPAIFWAGSELGPTFGDGVYYIIHSFEACLIRMFDAVGLRRETPQFWDAQYALLQYRWMAPDNTHRTNFPR